MSISELLSRLFGRDPKPVETPRSLYKAPTTHVILLDGTMSTLKDGCETNVGLLYKLLCEVNETAAIKLSLYYEPGLQWTDLRSGWNVMIGRGINQQIQRAYGFLASRYRAGDKVVLVGFSRGAYAVRSLAGVIDLVGLLKQKDATERHIRQAYRHYKFDPTSAASRSFRDLCCHAQTDIEAIAVWDTVKALGLVFPVVWRLSEHRHAFHSAGLGASVKNGFHAVAHGETRVAYTPVMWRSDPTWAGHMEQMWFPGTHGDVGGQLDGKHQSRPLANVSLNWMLGHLETCDVPLPQYWRTRFPMDAAAPSIGRWSGWAKMFLSRRRRDVGVDTSESLHVSLRRPL